MLHEDLDERNVRPGDDVEAAVAVGVRGLQVAHVDALAGVDPGARDRGAVERDPAADVDRFTRVVGRRFDHLQVGPDLAIPAPCALDRQPDVRPVGAAQLETAEPIGDRHRGAVDHGDVGDEDGRAAADHHARQRSPQGVDDGAGPHVLVLQRHVPPVPQPPRRPGVAGGADRQDAAVRRSARSPVAGRVGARHLDAAQLDGRALQGTRGIPFGVDVPGERLARVDVELQRVRGGRIARGVDDRDPRRPGRGPRAQLVAPGRQRPGVEATGVVGGQVEPTPHPRIGQRDADVDRGGGGLVVDQDRAADRDRRAVADRPRRWLGRAQHRRTRASRVHQRRHRAARDHGDRAQGDQRGPGCDAVTPVSTGRRRRDRDPHGRADTDPPPWLQAPA
ncbi:MAG: hypothetical protein KC464_35565 [Myxococcales bacterium]|nr:hypothetical protein [Myxococcales bacterium]